ncbi:hypothetical protein TGAM01_v207402 [Trichoderma gamsii]|uniref:Zn(2)-C6 fungal-type domain-containing protein n=1 Tax=Trichoderma gamsii TaxID=398673 RepID=A0A2P4ZHJ5_9HYPO|nr:hypothetical protein TGAM01_v207402 [Trichoderma gamsii]PON23755.1 hypothetical protein TGAM01_v207402 [Trichoderma gamsii]
MVGIGGRSRGCKTCRRARVKCDQNRPICFRCARLQLQCQGFNPFPVFIDGLSLNEIKADNATEGDRKEVSLLPAPSLDEDNIFTNHLIMSLFIPFQGSNTVPSPSLSLWLLSSILPSSKNQAPQLAVRACAAAYFGKIHRQCSAAERGTVLYTQALRQLQKELFDSEQVLKTDTLSATLLLALFEMITSKDMNGWLSHFLGVGHLIKFRGPQAHRDGPGKELFLTTRPSIILAYLIRRQRCFLEEDAWKTVPWADNPNSKTSMDCLNDIFCHLPGVMEDLQVPLQHAAVVQEAKISDIILCFQIKALFEKLYDWRVKWEQNFSHTYFNVGLGSLKDLNVFELDSYPFPTAIFFTEHLRVAEICIYNAMLLLLHQACRQLPDSIRPTVASYGNSYPWPHPSVLLTPGDGSVEDIIGEFCKLVYFQLLSYPGNTGAIQIMFPLQVAYRNANPESREARWLYKIISHIADCCGFNAVRFNEGLGYS